MVAPAKDAQGRWRYGDAGDHFPVEEGDVWQVGPHILACGDLEKGAAQSLLSQVSLPDMAICDPPWDAGNAHAFRTKAGDPRPVDFASLMTCILTCGSQVKGAWFFEMGRRNTPLVMTLIEAQGGHLLDCWETFYYRTKPCMFLRFSWKKEHTEEKGSGPSGMDEEDAFTWAITYGCQQGESILDLCIGRGLTARIAHAQGKRVIGLELHPRRLAVTIDWLVQQGLQATRLPIHL